MLPVMGHARLPFGVRSSLAIMLLSFSGVVCEIEIGRYASPTDQRHKYTGWDCAKCSHDEAWADQNHAKENCGALQECQSQVPIKSVGKTPCEKQKQKDGPKNVNDQKHSFTAALYVNRK